jgi:hypothetical protein
VASSLLKSLFNINESPLTLKLERGKDAYTLNKTRSSILNEFFKQRGAGKIWTKFTVGLSLTIFSCELKP